MSEMLNREKDAEAVVRAMRDQVYGKPLSDFSWSACGHNWMRPDQVQWLEEQVKKEFEGHPGARGYGIARPTG